MIQREGIMRGSAQSTPEALYKRKERSALSALFFDFSIITSEKGKEGDVFSVSLENLAVKIGEGAVGNGKGEAV